MTRCTVRRLLGALLACFGAVARAHAAEGDIWQVSDTGAMVIVEGDRAYASRVAMHVRQMQAAARWLMDWPTTYHPTQALVFLLREDTVRNHLLTPQAPTDVHVDPYTPVGASIATATLNVVVAPRGSERAVEFMPLHNLYGRTLIDQSPAAREWPQCPRVGMAALLTAATIRDRDRLFVDGEALGAWEALSPAEFLDPVATPPRRQGDADQRAYACYLLAHRVVVASHEEREAYQHLFADLSTSRPLIDSIPPLLGGSLTEFTKRYRTYASERLHAPAGHNLKAVLPGLEGDPPEPVAVSPERLAALLHQICTRLSRCPPDR